MTAGPVHGGGDEEAREAADVFYRVRKALRLEGLATLAEEFTATLEARKRYPHQDGDVTVLGPEIFASADGEVICWRGRNYEPQMHRAGERADAIPEAEWPIITAWIKADPGTTGASPVTLGVGREGPRVGYYSGGRCPADRSEYELWLRLDPHALAPFLRAAQPEAGNEEAQVRVQVIGSVHDWLAEHFPNAVEPFKAWAVGVRAAHLEADRAPEDEPGFHHLYGLTDDDYRGQMQ